MRISTHFLNMIKTSTCIFALLLMTSCNIAEPHAPDGDKIYMGDPFGSHGFATWAYDADGEFGVYAWVEIFLLDTLNSYSNVNINVSLFTTLENGYIDSVVAVESERAVNWMGDIETFDADMRQGEAEIWIYIPYQPGLVYMTYLNWNLDD